MQAGNPLNKIPGSFVKPPEAVRTQPSTTQNKPAQAPAQEAINPQTDSSESADAAEKVDDSKVRADKLAEIKKQLETGLDTVITEDDLEKYIFQGSFSKEVLILKTNKIALRGTFRTHTPSDTMKVDEAFAEFTAKGKNTGEGLANEKAMITLSHCWTHANGKAIGKNQEERLSRMRQMGAFMVENASRANTDFQLLLKISLEEGGLVKK